MNLKNLQGRRSKRKLLVIECDDWGSIRMPSLNIHTQMIRDKIPFSRNRFNDFDTIENKQDLEYLFEVLLSVRDKKGRAAVMTPVTNVANPDFKKIKERGFTEYFYEPFTETLKSYERDPDTLNTWKKGMEHGIFVPEMHGREHVSVQFWMQQLQKGNKNVLRAFDYKFIAVSVKGINPVLDQFRPEFYFNKPEQVEFLKIAVSDGIRLFKNIFGYSPRIFVPSNSLFHPVFEKDLAEAGVKYLYVNTFNPIPGKNGKIKYKYFKSGKKTSDGLIRYTRNCAFEPTDPRYRGIDFTLKQIEIAFRWNQPANISSHRVNFIGGIEKKNREKGLSELKLLLDKVVRNWPEVEFVSSAEMLTEIYPND